MGDAGFPTWDWKKAEKALYLPGSTPVRVSVPEMPFFVVAGEGSPDRPEFGQEIGALYALSYTIRMWAKKRPAPPGFVAYAVFPLEGVWDVTGAAKAEGKAGVPDRTAFAYELMIRQPPFVTDAFAAEAVSAAAEKIPPGIRARVRFERRTEGDCVQMLHLGPYADEPASFGRMARWCGEQGLSRTSRTHREIYLSNPGAVAPEKMRTVLRFGVRPKG